MEVYWGIPKGGNYEFHLMNTRAGGKIGKHIYTNGLNGLALYLPSMALKLKGHKIKTTYSVDLPSNWISIHPSFGPNAIQSMIVHRKAQLENFILHPNPKKYHRKRLLELPMDILISPIALPYYFFGRFALSKTFYANYTCTQCGKCERECPVQAIEMKQGRPFWKSKCESCMHCMGNCPSESIETAHGITALLTWVTLSVIPLALFKLAMLSDKFEVSPLGQKEESITLLIYLVISLPLIFLGYRLFHRLMGIKWLNRLVTYTSLTHYKFWRKYKFPE